MSVEDLLEVIEDFANTQKLTCRKCQEDVTVDSLHWDKGIRLHIAGVCKTSGCDMMGHIVVGTVGNGL